MIIKRTRIKAKTQTFVDESVAEVTEFADACYVCADEGTDTNLLVCDNCNYKVAHLQCLGYDSVPDGVWNCTMCTD